ncbi:MAG: DUF3604 domain-containing protein [Bryobacteraceae bacterium]|nr:DUF3604 domain-containing protein [Bryobacteraceae bacterium]MDW8379908.1 hypothetical protein [Bryobacterales bacterium]
MICRLVITWCLLSNLLAQPSRQARTGVRILMGLTDREPTNWDGAISAKGARITAIEPWRFEEKDTLLEGGRWQMSTHPPRLFGAAQQLNRTPVANGVLVWLDEDAATVELEVTTTQGSFGFRLGSVPYGESLNLLHGRVMVDRIPPYVRITDSKDEQDYPAVAVDKDGTLWLAYLESKHHPEHNKIRANLLQPPENFELYQTPPPGDQILLCKYQNGQWSPPVAVSNPGGDLYRPAVAVDRQGVVWVFWSQAERGEFDLWVKPVRGGRPGSAIRLSNSPGADVFPVATADSQGRVWVAWQAWRKGKATILAAVQNGNRFSSPLTVSSSAGNEWNPAIAANSSGRVTVVYDSYRNGNYDVFARTVVNGVWEKEFLVAGELTYNAYPSAAYDPQGRLWVAYEEGAERWGKDFGAHNTTGIALYQGRAIRIRGFERDGRSIVLPSPPDQVLPGTPNLRVDGAGRQLEGPVLKPDANRAKERPPSRPSPNYLGPKNTAPRLLVDASGRLWLAVRSAHPIWWSPIGTVWSEYVISYDGSQWTGPIFLAHSDNLLDNRPAVTSLTPGELLVIGSSDHRRQFQLARPRARASVVVEDPYNNDLFLNRVTLKAAPKPFDVVSAPSPVLAAADPRDREEAAAIQPLRAYRLQTKSGELRILRGEFHRHSEISSDGGNDGSILDQYRYILDPADMDWVGCCDHDNGGGREYSWWISQKLTDLFHAPGKFIPMFSYERSVPYPEGHRNVVFAQRGIRPLPRLPVSSLEPVTKAPDTQMLYRYLRHFQGIAAMHTSSTNMGTDWRDNDPVAEPVVEIYQGDRQNYEMPGAPRSNSAEDSIGGWRPKGFVSLALEMGYKLGFQASSDHVSTHQSYCNLLVREFSRQAVMEAFRNRHIYGATDNILAEFRCGDFIMGDSFALDRAPEFHIQLIGTAPFAKVVIVKNNQYVYATQPNAKVVKFTWRDTDSAPGKTSFYYVRGEQQDGELVWVSPMWIERK